MAAQAAIIEETKDVFDLCISTMLLHDDNHEKAPFWVSVGGQWTLALFASLAASLPI